MTNNAALNTASPPVRWEEILAPQATQYIHNPSHVMDFKRFSASMFTECLTEQIDIIKAATPDVPVTTNFMLPTWNHYDQWAFAEKIDQVSIDHYLDDSGLAGDTGVSLAGDLARSFNAGRPWLLMEQATSLIYDYAGGRTLVKEPGRMRRNTMQYLARGATGSLFFQWRSPRVGAEFFHSAMVPHAGEHTRLFREVSELGDELGQLGELASPPDHGPVNEHDVAIAWHPDAWWAAETPALPSSDISFLDAVRRTHNALWNLGINTDFVSPDGDISRYKLVLVPSMLAISDEQSARFAEFVGNGGHVAVWHFAGTTDEHLRVRLGGYSQGFATILGIRVEEHVPLPPGTIATLDDGSTSTVWTEHVHLDGARAVAAYTSDAHPIIPPGSPAITESTTGSGAAHYISTHLETAALEQHLERICSVAGVAKEHPAAGRGLEIVRRRGGDNDYLFFFNHGDSPRTAHLVGTDLLSGHDFDGATLLNPGDIYILRAPDEA